MDAEQTRHRVTFYFGEKDSHGITLVTSPDDDETLEEYLGAKLGADTPTFAAFGDGAGGFDLINTSQITRVTVRQVSETA